MNWCVSGWKSVVFKNLIGKKIHTYNISLQRNFVIFLKGSLHIVVMLGLKSLKVSNILDPSEIPLLY